MSIASRAEILTYLNKAGTGSLTTHELGLLTLLHPLAEQAIKSYLWNDVEYAQHVEFLPVGISSGSVDTLAGYDVVNGRIIPSGRYARHDRLQLKHTPVVTTGLEVREDTGGYAGQGTDAFAASTILTLGTDYYLDLDETGLSRSGVLIRTAGTWPLTPRSIKATYYGGWTAAQLAAGGAAAPIKLAAILTVCKAFWEAKTNAQSNGAGAIVSETIGKYSATYGQSAGGNAGLLLDLPGEARELLEPFRNFGNYIA